MVCKRSLYCWKNGPCASDQTRKQIWEENIKFRESLRDINQSDHYWSFQISKNKCLCLEGEDLHCDRPFSRKYRSASFQRLHDIDCASITHDFNGLKFRNCFVHCPIHYSSKNSENKRADTPVAQSLAKKENPLACLRYPFKSLHKSDEDKNYCHRYKNTLLKSTLKPSMKTKFLSQLDLTSLDDNKSQLEKKYLHSSCENIQSKLKKEDQKDSSNQTGKEHKALNEVKAQGDEKKESENKKSDCEVQTEDVKVKKRKEVKTNGKLPSQNVTNEFSPLSRTTRKMLAGTKKIPFITYGCNNRNLDIGSKRTHNVFASRPEVYPNALLAKQQKKDFIMKHIQSEKELQKKYLPEELKRRINHSSLWSLDASKNETKSVQKRSNNRHLLPLMNKPLKKVNVASSQHDYAHYKVCRKPQIYFY